MLGLVWGLQSARHQLYLYHAELLMETFRYWNASKDSALTTGHGITFNSTIIGLPFLPETYLNHLRPRFFFLSGKCTPKTKQTQFDIITLEKTIMYTFECQSTTKCEILYLFYLESQLIIPLTFTWPEKCPQNMQIWSTITDTLNACTETKF